MTHYLLGLDNRFGTREVGDYLVTASYQGQEWTTTNGNCSCLKLGGLHGTQSSYLLSSALTQVYAEWLVQRDRYRDMLPTRCDWLCFAVWRGVTKNGGTVDDIKRGRYYLACRWGVFHCSPLGFVASSSERKHEVLPLTATKNSLRHTADM